MDFTSSNSRLMPYLAIALISFSSRAEEPPSVTVEAQKQHIELEHDVQAFAHQAIIRPPSVYNQSLERWNVPVCPQVAGLDRAKGEFLLSRLSEIARATGVPLAGESCSANFIVFVTGEPEPLLKKMIRQRNLFDGSEDKSELNDFVMSPRPVRIWRNIYLTTVDGSQHIKAHGEKQYNDEPHTTSMPSQYGSRLFVGAVTRDISSAIIVVDASRVSELNIGQLGDYISMIGFAQVNLDQQISDVPTILNLFRLPRETRPLEMTKWDKALLRGLYSSAQRDVTQISQLESIAVRELEDGRSP